MVFTLSIAHIIIKKIKKKELLQNKGDNKMLERVIEIIKDQLNLEGTEITEDSSFKDDLGADSLDLFELVMAFEEEYGIEIPTEELEEINTVGDIVEFMKSKGVEA